jgi:hypothetical protein
VPRTTTLKLTADELSQLHIALDARIEGLEQAAGDDPDAVTSGLVAMRRNLDRDGPGGPSAVVSPKIQIAWTSV